MTAPAKPLTLEQAQQRHQDALHQLDAIHQRLLAGDPAADLAAVTAAEDAEQFARLQTEAAEQRLAAEQERRQERAQQQARTRLAAIEKRADQVQARLADASQAVATAVAEAIAYKAELLDATNQVHPGERPSVRLCPVADVLDAIRPVLGGPVYPGYVELDDVRHTMRAWGG
jgi:hypothetical protein